MAQVLVDTSALVAFFVQSEKHHLAIKNYVLEHPTVQWVILSSVFDETVTWLRLRVSVQASIKIGRVLREEHTYTDSFRLQSAFLKNFVSLPFDGVNGLQIERKFEKLQSIL